MYNTYIIKKERMIRYYIGYTSNLRRRFKEHSIRTKCKLIYYETYLDEDLAKKRELKLKQFGGA